MKNHRFRWMIPTCKEKWWIWFKMFHEATTSYGWQSGCKFSIKRMPVLVAIISRVACTARVQNSQLKGYLWPIHLTIAKFQVEYEADPNDTKLSPNPYIIGSLTHLLLAKIILPLRAATFCACLALTSASSSSSPLSAWRITMANITLTLACWTLPFFHRTFPSPGLVHPGPLSQSRLVFHGAADLLLSARTTEDFCWRSVWEQKLIETRNNQAFLGWMLSSWKGAMPFLTS